MKNLNQFYNYKNAIKHNFISFLIKSFYTINSSARYLHNWHLDLISEYIDAIERGEIKRLIINVPPRSLKSVSISVALPMWTLGKDSSKRIIVSSYSEALAIKHSLDSRLIANSQWFKKIFPKFKISASQNEKHKFLTSKNGFRFATSVGGTLTGEGGDILIIDDPHNPQQIMSEKYRQSTLDWFSNTFSSRLNDKKNGVIIIVMQRLHEDDLTGHLLKRGGWHLLSLSAVAEKNEEISFGSFHKFRRKGELLHSTREGMVEIERIKQDMGSYVFAAQYQQNPIAKSGGLVNCNWFKKYDEIKDIEEVFLSLDTAIKAGINNDPTVCTVWGEKDGDFYLIDVVREWLEYPELKRLTLKLIEKHNPNGVLIEDKASGQSLIQDLKREKIGNIIPIKVFKDKLTRFASITPTIEAGRVFLPRNANWLVDFENEVYSFPHGKNDDQVDSLSQFLSWRKSSINRSVKKIRKL